jgi:acetoin utilization deacetylase AcuC-like enzyme
MAPGRSRRSIRRNIWCFSRPSTPAGQRIEGCLRRGDPQHPPGPALGKLSALRRRAGGVPSGRHGLSHRVRHLESAYWSAQSALTAGDLVAGGERSAYALCRPPGHHAFGDLAGGFCFLNNAAIVAEHLRLQGLRPAILDVDVHHGNGTQGIFYDRADVLTVSIHADPIRFYPFFWGHAHERGEGAGLGCNLNLPLQRGTGDDDYMTTLETAFAHIRAFGTDVLIVALGLDASENDPLKGLAITTPGFNRMGAAIAGMDLPTVLVQEGGYLQPQLGDNLTSFLTGFKGE